MQRCVWLALIGWGTSGFALQALGEEVQVAALVKLIDEAEVPALEAGLLEVFSAHDGAKVAAGQLLVKLVDRDVQLLCDRQRRELEVAREKAENQTKVQSAEAAFKVAESEVQRARDARQRFADAVSDSEFDRLQLAAKQASLAVNQARHEVEVARLEAALQQSELDIAERRLERHQIVAPFDGVVAQTYRRRGEWVQPGEKVLRLVRVDSLKAEGFIPFDKLVGITIGAPVKLTVSGAGGGTFEGKLVFISPETDPFNGQVRITAEIANPKGTLRPGSKGNLNIHVKR